MNQPKEFSFYARRNLFIFSVTRLISELGSSIFKFALSLYILDITGSATVFSMVLGLSILPGVFVNIFAGVVIDRSNKKKVLVITEILSGIALLIFLPIFLLDSTNVMLLAVFSVILSLIQSFTFLTLNASIPNLVERDNVHSVNSSYQSIGAIINVLGPILGAITYRAWGLETIVMINGITFISAGLMQLWLQFRKTDEQTVSSSYLDSVKDVFAYINKQKAIMYLLVIFVGINFMLAPLVQVVLPYVTYQELQLSAQQLSVIQGAWFVGVIAGAIVVSRRKVHQFVITKIFILFQLQAILFLTWCFPLLFPSTSGSLIQMTFIFIMILAVTGFFNSMSNVPMISYVQLYTPEHIRAGVFGVISSITMLATPLGIGLYGILLDRIHWVYLPLASGIVALVMGIMAHKNKALRNFFSQSAEPVLNSVGEKERVSAL
ncbi:MFS transporter [Paenibacillus polymyxa]|uniref:MFS transporter n=1 Tax=Paenibacillus polymyxa TaxID=1406 RepID=UPI000C9F8E4E|nr:MFS transporter [Paenibacillus polymyxa]PNQ84805.1 arabinose ABC transporter permease [Paenibacillus polymyxa]